MWILVIAGLSVAPIFLGFLMEPWLPLGHWGWGALLFLCLLPSAIYWRKKMRAYPLDVLQSWRKWSKTTTKAPPLDRQPINQAYEYLVDLRVVQEDGHEPMQVAGLLRQAALDGGIMIWGSEPSSAPVGWQASILLEINRGYWRHHEIDAVRLMIDASELPDEGCKTQRESRPWDDQTECYWHLHVDMNQVRSKWTDNHETDA